MTPAEIDWGPDGVKVTAWERDARWFRRCMAKDCPTILSEYNGRLFCWVHRKEGAPWR